MREPVMVGEVWHRLGLPVGIQEAVADYHARQVDLSIRVEQIGRARDIDGRMSLAGEH